jgi:hypothetical protein
MSEALKFIKQFLKNNYLLLILLAVDFFLLVVHLIYGNTNDFFNFDRERNLPTAWAATQCLLAAYFWFSWHRSLKNDKIIKRSQQIFVYLGTVIFLYIACDEFLQWHESFGDQLGSYLKSIDWGVMFWRHNPVFSWLLVFAVPLLFLGVFFLWTAWRLWNRRVFWQVVAAASLFVLGAYGIEFLGSLSFNEVWQKIPYWYLVTVEEFAELLSISFLIGIFYKNKLEK